MRRPTFNETLHLRTALACSQNVREEIQIAWDKQRIETVPPDKFSMIRSDELDLFEKILDELTGNGLPSKEPLLKLIELRRERYYPDATCCVCGGPVDTFDAEFCCDGHDCGCMGRPIEPAFCSVECAKARNYFGVPSVLIEVANQRFSAGRMKHGKLCFHIKVASDEYGNIANLGCPDFNSGITDEEQSSVMDWAWQYIQSKTSSWGWQDNARRGARAYLVAAMVDRRSLEIDMEVVRSHSNENHTFVLDECEDCDGTGSVRCPPPIDSADRDENGQLASAEETCGTCHGTGFV